MPLEDGLAFWEKRRVALLYSDPTHQICVQETELGWRGLALSGSVIQSLTTQPFKGGILTTVSYALYGRVTVKV